MAFAALDLLQLKPHDTNVASKSLSNVTIFCDFDGPLVDVSNRYYSTYQLALTKVWDAHQSQGMALPLHQLSKEQFWQMKQERTPDPEIAMRSGLQGQQIDLFLQQVSQIVNQPTLLHQDQLQPGVKWALSLLHARGAQLVLVTLRDRAQAVQILEGHGLYQWFSGIWGAEDDSIAYANSVQHKTHLLAMAMAAVAAGGVSSAHSSGRQAQGSSAWMIGDTEADVLAGQAMNLPTIALTCGIRSQAYLQRFQPTRIRPNLLAAVHELIYLNHQATPRVHGNSEVRCQRIAL